MAIPSYQELQNSEKLLSDTEGRLAQATARRDDAQRRFDSGGLNITAALEQSRANQEVIGLTTEVGRLRQFTAERRKAEIENMRSVRTAVRQARLARAALLNTASQTGTSASSGVAGGAGSIQSQLASNLSFFSQMHTLNTQSAQGQLQQAYAQDELNKLMMYRQEKARKQAQRMSYIQLGASMFGAG